MNLGHILFFARFFLYLFFRIFSHRPYNTLIICWWRRKKLQIVEWATKVNFHTTTLKLQAISGQWFGWCIFYFLFFFIYILVVHWLIQNRIAGVHLKFPANQPLFSSSFNRTENTHKRSQLLFIVASFSTHIHRTLCECAVQSTPRLKCYRNERISPVTPHCHHHTILELIDTDIHIELSAPTLEAAGCVCCIYTVQLKSFLNKLKLIAKYHSICNLNSLWGKWWDEMK